MQILLDTHTMLWFINGDKQLPANVRELIEDIDNQCFVSIASLWEITIKHSQQKLELDMDFDEMYTLLSDNDIEIMPITFNHLRTLLPLPYHHRDPFDRMIIAQGISERIKIATKDEFFVSYEVGIIWK
ncbi:MAG: type II toxin-antitoxin system VapC family toxin [Saprospiraceae bacterium]